MVGVNCASPTSDNIEAILKFERPRTVKQVRSFMGTVNFYRKFIHNITEIAAPLYGLIKKNCTKVEWTDECEIAFNTLKKALTSAPLLVFPDFTKPFYVNSDASNIGIGGVLEQEIDGDFRPIAYASRKLNAAERNYSVIEREALAIVFSLTQFRYLIYGFPVILKTDHKPLTYIFKLKDTNQRLVRWLLLIQDYDIKIQHISGRENYIADFLSRGLDEMESNSIGVIREAYEPLTNIRIKKAQDSDPICTKIVEKLISEGYDDNEYIFDDDMVLLKLVFPGRVSGWKYRVVVPQSLVRDVLYNYHDRVHSGHLSLPKVAWKVKQVFTWDTMFKDISSYVQTCESCQRRKQHHTRAPFQPITPPSYPMQRLNVDIVGPFEKNSSKMKYLLVYTDSLSRFTIANPIENMEAVTVANDYINNVLCVHGASEEILTDRGSQFMGKVFETLCKRLGIKHVATSGYRPSSNGIAERSNQKIINILAQSCNKYYSDWPQQIKFVTFAINNSPNRSSGESPFYLFHAFDPIDPVVEASFKYRAKHDNIPEFVEQTASKIELARADVVSNLTLSSIKNCDSKNIGRRLREFDVGQKVLYLDSSSFSGKNRKLKTRYLGPYRIIQRLGLVNYKIRNLLNIKDVRTTHVDKIKLYFPRYVLDDSIPHRVNTRQRAIARDSTQQYLNNEESLYLYLPPSFPVPTQTGPSPSLAHASGDDGLTIGNENTGTNPNIEIYTPIESVGNPVINGLISDVSTGKAPNSLNQIENICNDSLNKTSIMDSSKNRQDVIDYGVANTDSNVTTYETDSQSLVINTDNVASITEPDFQNLVVNNNNNYEFDTNTLLPTNNMQDMATFNSGNNDNDLVVEISKDVTTSVPDIVHNYETLTNTVMDDINTQIMDLTNTTIQITTPQNMDIDYTHIYSPQRMLADNIFPKVGMGNNISMIPDIQEVELSVEVTEEVTIIPADTADPSCIELSPAYETVLLPVKQEN